MQEGSSEDAHSWCQRSGEAVERSARGRPHSPFWVLILAQSPRRG